MGPKSEQRLHNLFKKHTKELNLERFIKKWFGPKCIDFDEHCECCKRWKAYEELTNNPFDKNE